MTAYYAQSVAQAIGVRAVTYEIRITQVSIFCSGAGAYITTAVRHETSSLSGGSTADVVPLHQGAPAASATARAGSLTFSGTAKVVGSTYVPPGQNTVILAYGTDTIHQGSTAQITSPLTLTVAPGSVFHVTPVGAATTVQVYFEELRLPGSY